MTLRGPFRSYRVPVLLAFATLLTAGTLLAVHDIGLFELDRNAQDPGGAPLPDDWATLYGGGGSAAEFTGILADIAAPGTQFHGGGSKDNNDISQWLWVPGEPLDKDDITNAYAAAYVNPVDVGSNKAGDLIVYFGLDRFANNGSAQVGFWFFQNPIGLTNTAQSGGFKFSGVHKVGDVLVQSNFTQGGVISSISVFEWVGSGGSNGALNLRYQAQDCLAGAPGDDLACATVNQGGTPSPWPFTPKFGAAGTFPQGSFFEGGINITRLVPDAGCFTGVLAETRTSTPFDSRLKDFVLGNFELCKIDVVKTGDTLSKIGDPVHYTVTVTNSGAITLYNQSISDTLLGDLDDQNNGYVTSTSCDGSATALAPGASCTIEAARTVQAGDPDPLPNTVTAVYDNHVALDGSEVTDSDDHSVNLFYPAVAAAKTGDTLSKVGDTVTYTVTLSNNSSADTPPLDCTATDSLLSGAQATIFDTVLPLGDTVVTYSYLVPAGAPDPLENTVSLSCTPQGFSNTFTASAGHSVDLFQPSIAVDKTGDTLSKVGDSVDYTITLTNSSSGDTPALNCSATDSLLGNVFSGVLPSGNTVIHKSRTVQQGDPDPLTNTVTLTCSPAGFINVLTASDSHSVNLFKPAIAVDKTGDTLSKVGDSVDYTITLSNNSSGDTPAMTCTAIDTLFGKVFDGVLPVGNTVIQKSRAVQQGDPDPLVNTVTLTCSAAGFPNVFTASDSHSVNLFTPGIAVFKTGDALSKVGDTVDYLITLSNTSSADTPALNCTATDSLLGVVYNTVLPLGNTVIPAQRAVQAGDPDPLVNTLSMTCSVAGFPNVLGPVTAMVTTQLFQPAVQVVKTGPSTAARGDTITYSFTINNLGSADSPNLILDSVTDTVLGDLTAAATAANCGTLASGGSCSFTFDYTIQNSDPSPLVNVVTVHYHPSGFPNDITDNDDHQVLIPILGCTPGFWQGGAGAPLWDQVNDPQWVYNGTNPFIHTTLFNDFFNQTTDSRLNGLTMYDLVSSGGTSDSARRAARDMVAAYLNESAFPADFPATSLADLKAMWYAAVAGGDSALDAFHNLVSGWNSPTSPGYCPLP